MYNYMGHGKYKAVFSDIDESLPHTRDFSRELGDFS